MAHWHKNGPYSTLMHVDATREDFARGAKLMRDHHRSIERVARRSRRNQPPASGPRCETCEDTGECMTAVLLPSGHHETVEACTDCEGKPRRVRRASVSRKRRPHGRN